MRVPSPAMGMAIFKVSSILGCLPGKFFSLFDYRTL